MYAHSDSVLAVYLMYRLYFLIRINVTVCASFITKMEDATGTKHLSLPWSRVRASFGKSKRDWRDRKSFSRNRGKRLRWRSRNTWKQSGDWIEKYV